MQKFCFIVLAFLFGFSTILHAQQSRLTGRVIDADNGKPLPGAHVYIQGTNIGTAANNKGAYQLRKLESGTYEVILSYSGYKRIKDTVRLDDETMIRNYELNRSDKSLGEVVVTGTGTAHHLKNAPVPTELISSKAVESVEASDFNELMKSVSPSFDFSPNRMGSFMTINGLGNDYITVLIDGKRMYGDIGGNNDLSRLNPDNIERVEVLKGASSLLYGSDAIAGVVNVITKEKEQSVDLTNHTRLKSYNTWQQHNSVDINAGPFSSRTSFTRKSSDGWQLSDYELDDGEPVETDAKAQNAYQDYTLNQKLEYKATPNLDFYVEGSYYEKEVYNPQSVRSYDYNYEDLTYGAGAKYRLDDRDYVSLDYHHDKYLYFYRYNQNYREYAEGDRKQNNDQRLDNVQAKYVNHISGNNTLTLGADYMNEQMFSDDRVIGDEAEAYTMALYAQEELTFFDAMDVVAGLRYVNHKEFGSAFTPKVSLLYKTGNVNLRGTYGFGFKAPTLKELYYDYERRGRVYMGNDELDPEESEFLSAGVEYINNDLSISVTGYRNDVDNMIEYETVDLEPGDDEDGIKARRKHFNIEEARSQGIDFLFDVKAGYGFTIGGGYSFVDAMNLTSDVRLEGVARNYGNVRLGYDRQWNQYDLNANIIGRIQDEKFYDDGNASAYNIWKLTTRHGFSGLGNFKLEVSAGIDNIFDFVDDSPYGSHYGTLSPGRTYFMALKVNFAG
ncbi:MAG: TonB-dependent receptor [Bacteroidota bacterium]